MSLDHQIYLHIVFTTKDLLPCLKGERLGDFTAAFRVALNGLSCHDGHIGVSPEHVHLMAYVHPDYSIDSFMAAVKRATADWIARENPFEAFPGWQAGYIAFSISPEDRAETIAYILADPERHKTLTFVQEARAFLDEMGYENEVPDFS